MAIEASLVPLAAPVPVPRSAVPLFRTYPPCVQSHRRRDFPSEARIGIGIRAFESKEHQRDGEQRTGTVHGRGGWLVVVGPAAAGATATA